MKNRIGIILFLFVSTTYSLFNVPVILCQTSLINGKCNKTVFSLPKDTSPPLPEYIGIGCGYIRGRVFDYPDDNIVRSNLDSIIFIEDSSYNYTFECNPYTPGKSRYTYWNLDPVDCYKDARAVIRFTDMAGNDTTIDIRYYFFKISITENAYNFGLYKLSSQLVKHRFTLRNESKGMVYINRIGFKYENQNFSVDSSTIKLIPFFLNTRDSFKFDVIFNPEMIGKFSDSLGVGDTCWFFYQSEIKARVDEPAITVSDVNFDTVPIHGQYVYKDFTISNHGGYDLKITGSSGLNNSNFSTDLAKISLSKPLIISPNNFVKYTVFFKPEKEGIFHDSICFFNDACKTDSVCSIEGVAITPVNARLFDEASYFNISVNSFNSTLNYKFWLTEPGFADIRLIDLTGNILQNYEIFYYSGGEQNGIINTSSLFSGVYFLELRCKKALLRNKFTIIK